MALHLIIDGYNLIRQSPWLSRVDAEDLEAGREALLERLSHYRRRRPQHKVTVVFDGWQGGGLRESRDLWGGVGVVFSRRGERADEVIKRLLGREGSRAVVVTSDREIQEFAREVRATWVAATQFEMEYLHDDSRHDEDDEEAPQLASGGAKRGPARRVKKSQRQQRRRLRKL